MRLIDEDAYIKYCDENRTPLNVDAVEAQPTVDAVPVVMINGYIIYGGERKTDDENETNRR